MRNRTAFSVVQLILSLVGTFDAGTLYYAHRNNIELPCMAGGACDLVAASHWAYFDGIPVALLGTCAYIALALMSVLKLYSEQERFAAVMLWLVLLITAGGAAFSWHLQYVSHVYIGVICPYCFGSAVVMTLLFLSAVIERVLPAQMWTPGQVTDGVAKDVTVTGK